MQRDLFLAEIRAFPLARTVEVRRMVRFLTICHGHHADKHYRERCRELAKRMRAAGVNEHDVRRQINDFQETVQRELWTQSQAHKEGGAA